MPPTEIMAVPREEGDTSKRVNGPHFESGVESAGAGNENRQCTITTKKQMGGEVAKPWNSMRQQKIFRRLHSGSGRDSRLCASALGPPARHQHALIPDWWRLPQTPAHRARCKELQARGTISINRNLRMSPIRAPEVSK